MAPVFSRNAWRCTWHMIQVHSPSVVFLSFLLLYHRYNNLNYCVNPRMTWSMVGVLTLHFKDVLRLVFIPLYATQSLCFRHQKHLSWFVATCSWEDWSRRCSTHCSSRHTFTFGNKRTLWNICIYNSMLTLLIINFLSAGEELREWEI